MAAFKIDLRDCVGGLQAALVAAAGAGPALPARPAFPPAALPQPSALRLAVDIACISGQALCEAADAAQAEPVLPAGLEGSVRTASCAGQEGDQARSGLAAWVVGAALECELRSAWVRACRAPFCSNTKICDARSVMYISSLLCMASCIVHNCHCAVRSSATPRSNRRILAVPVNGQFCSAVASTAAAGRSGPYMCGHLQDACAQRDSQGRLQGKPLSSVHLKLAAASAALGTLAPLRAGDEPALRWFARCGNVAWARSLDSPQRPTHHTMLASNFGILLLTTAFVGVRRASRDAAAGGHTAGRR